MVPVIDPMTLAEFALVGGFAGALGAVVGIGGGVLLVPVLTLLFRVPPHIAVATSLVGVVATSTAAGSVYVGSGVANMRLGMALEVATTIGGIVGGLMAARVSKTALTSIFAVLLVVVAVLLARGREADPSDPSVSHDHAKPASTPMGHEERGRLAGAYYDELAGRLVPYEASRLPLGAAISLLAGLASGLFGVGGGFLKVPAMAVGMRVPVRVAAAASNFMIGVTATASLFISTRIAGKLPTRALRLMTAAVLLFVAVQMAVRAMHLSETGHVAG